MTYLMHSGCRFRRRTLKVNVILWRQTLHKSVEIRHTREVNMEKSLPYYRHNHAPMFAELFWLIPFLSSRQHVTLLTFCPSILHFHTRATPTFLTILSWFEFIPTAKVKNNVTDSSGSPREPPPPWSSFGDTFLQIGMLINFLRLTSCWGLSLPIPSPPLSTPLQNQ